MVEVFYSCDTRTKTHEFDIEFERQDADPSVGIFQCGYEDVCITSWNGVVFDKNKPSHRKAFEKAYNLLDKKLTFHDKLSEAANSYEDDYYYEDY